MPVWTLGRRRRVTFFWWRPMSAVSSARPKKAKKLMETLTQLESEYGVAWQCRPESDEAIARIDYVLQKVCGGYFQPFFERNDLIKDWWDK